MMRQLNELLHPHIILHLIVIAGIVALWRVRPPIPRRRLLWVTIPFAILSVVCIPAVTYFIVGTLEWPYPPLAQRPAEGDVIVVLSGYVRPPDDINPEPELGINTFFRCLRAAELYRQGPRCPLIVSGGNVDGAEGGPTCAQAMGSILLKLGVSADDLILEKRSRNTFENARESAAILRQRQLAHPILVTDATHLWRSELCFRKQGVDIIPCGCYYRASTFSVQPIDFLPDVTVMETVDQVFHEWLGLAWYWLSGKI